MEIQDIITMMISALALVVSIYSFRQSNAIATYQGLDTGYFELLKLGMQNPRFVNPQLTKQYTESFTGDELLQYDLYAFMVWNICETIYDRSNMTSVSSTWDCIIEVESKLHRTWFDNDKNHCRFKPKFKKYLEKRFGKSENAAL